MPRGPRAAAFGGRCIAWGVLCVATACGGAGDSNGGAPVAPATPVVTTISLDKTSLTFGDIGETETIRATAKDQFGSTMPGVTFAWTSSAPLVATVSSAGVVTTTGLGTAQIAASVGDKSAQATVSVPRAVKTVVLDRTSLTFGSIGQRDTLRATARDQLSQPLSGAAFTWTSSDTSIATVDANGIVTARAPGTAQIRATASAKSATAQVSVTSARDETVLCTGGSPTVMLLVQADLKSPLSTQLTRFGNDLCADGYTAWLANAVPATPPEIRAYLADAWTRSARRLTGAILVGSIPYAYQYVVLHSTNPSIPDTKEEAISFQYYSDLDGTFSRSAGFASPRQFSFDLHSGSVDWELWIGVLPTYKGDRVATINALTRYFDKNHAYRTGGAKPPRGFVEVNEHFTSTTAADDNFYLSSLRDGQYSWTPFSNSSSARLYFNGSTPALKISLGYADLQAGVADFFEQDAHGFFGAAGQLTIATVESTPVRSIFFWSNGCAIGDLDHADNFLTSIVYSQTSSVLAAKGTTNDSGGMGNNQSGYFGHNVAVALNGGASLGAAMLSHVNVPLIAPWSGDRDFFFGTPIIVGDPTLKLRP